MDHLERVGHLQPRLVAFVVALLALTGCIADDETPASFGRGSTTEPPLPVATEPVSESTEPAESADDGDPGDEASSTTATTQPLDPLLGLRAELVADGFDQPILVTSAPGTDLLYVVEREGIVRVVDDGVIADEPFLDLRDQLLSSSIEQGLLGLAFHPDFASNSLLYAYWTDEAGDSMLAELHAESTLTVDPDSVRVILQVDQPAERHNAGTLLFGPDGLLYLSLGDGGSGGSTAQDTSNLLGSIVRLDVDGGDPYAVPSGNPFGDEIWVYGLRNPWRFSIDPVDRLVYIGDVGQETFEEVNIASLDDGAGTNFGWFEMEGDRCFRSACDPEDFTAPVLQYPRSEGCSVTGGWVYRGSAIPEFDGHYFFADWCKGFVRSMRLDDGRVLDQFDWTADMPELGQVTSFGLDNEAELLIVNWDGQLFRIVPIR